MEETRLAKAGRDIPAADLTTEALPGAPEPAQRPPLQPCELDGALDGIEITRLPWGYAVTRTTRTS